MEAGSHVRRTVTGGLAALALMSAPVRATGPFENILYTVRASSMSQQQSNPFRADRGSDEERSDTAVYNAIRAAAIVPLASERTRLELSGTYGDARYRTYSQLDHDPLRLDAALPWQAGHLFAGSFGYSRNRQLYRYLERTWPDADVVDRVQRRAELGMRITDSLTLPLLSGGRERVRYRNEIDSMPFDRDSDWSQLAVRYTGLGRSVATLGLRHSDGTYLARTDELAAAVGRRYRDRELFVDAAWDVGAKSIVAGRLGWRRREYPDLTEREASLLTTYFRAGWDYSIKTRFDFSAWRQAYPNDQDVDVLYSTFSGAQLAVRWQATPKLWWSLNLVNERQDDHIIGGETLRDATRSLRVGARAEWTIGRNVQLFMDAWRDRTRGRQGRSDYLDNTFRFGITVWHDNGDERPQRLLWNAECDPPRYVEASACHP